MGATGHRIVEGTVERVSTSNSFVYVDGEECRIGRYEPSGFDWRSLLPGMRVRVYIGASGYAYKIESLEPALTKSRIRDLRRLDAIMRNIKEIAAKTGNKNQPCKLRSTYTEKTRIIDLPIGGTIIIDEDD